MKVLHIRNSILTYQSFWCCSIQYANVQWGILKVSKTWCMQYQNTAAQCKWSMACSNTWHMYIGNCRHAEMRNLLTTATVWVMVVLPLMCSIVGHTMEAKHLPQSQIDLYQIEGSTVWTKSICESSDLLNHLFCFTVAHTLRSSQTRSQHLPFKTQSLHSQTNFSFSFKTRNVNRSLNRPAWEERRHSSLSTSLTNILRLIKQPRVIICPPNTLAHVTSQESDLWATLMSVLISFR